MRKIILMVFAIFLISGNFAMAQNNGIDRSTETQKMGNYKVKESTKPIDIPNIAVLDYGRIKIKKEKKTKTGKKTIEFYNAKGKLIKQLKLGRWDKPRISQNRKLIGIQKYGFKNQELEIFNENGKKKEKFKNVRPYGKIEILNDKSFIVFGTRNTPHIANNGGIAFYSNKGELIKEIIFKPLCNSFGEIFNTKYFSFLSECPSFTTLYCYGWTGNFLWKFSFKNARFPYHNILKLISSVGDKLYIRLILDNQNYTWIFNKDGLVEKKKGW